jgi:alpha-tubulin suppressor-like RCC1 family protein
VSNTPMDTGFTAIAGGCFAAYALRADGSIAAWGDDGYSWGGGAVSNALAGTGFTAIAAGFCDGYALRADGSIAAWGWNASGQVSGIPTDTGFTAIAAGCYTGYALTPEPATLLLFGLGGLVLRRGRR